MDLAVASRLSPIVFVLGLMLVSSNLSAQDSGRIVRTENLEMTGLARIHPGTRTIRTAQLEMKGFAYLHPGARAIRTAQLEMKGLALPHPGPRSIRTDQLQMAGLAGSGASTEDAVPLPVTDTPGINRLIYPIYPIKYPIEGT